MQSDAVTNPILFGRTVLIAPDKAHGELATELERHGARVLTWPRLDISYLNCHAAVDEAIENLYGYDWLIFRNINAVDFFLRRLRELKRDISELDALRVCAIGEATHRRLEQCQVHVDVIPDRLSSAAALLAIESYAGGHNALGGLNFLMPRAAIATDSLTRSLEEAGARVDEVTTYRTSSPEKPDLAQIKGLLTGGGIDCVGFASASEIWDFAAAFDTNDLGSLFTDTLVACADESTTQTAAEFGVQVDIMAAESTPMALAFVVSEYFGMKGR